MEIIFPSRHEAMSDTDYRQVAIISQTTLKKILTSPLHFYDALLHPEPPTDAQMLGTATHHTLLGGGDCPMIMRPEDLSPYTKEGKAWKADQLAKGKIVVDQDAMTKVTGMCESLQDDPEIKASLAGLKEVSCFAELKSPEGEPVECKCRFDSLPKSSDTIVDLKTCRSGSLHALTSDIAKFNYAFQAVHYLKMFEATRGEKEPKRDKFLFIFVESDPPHATRKIMLSDLWMSQAEQSWERAMTLLCECRATGEWPGYGQEIFVLNPPNRDDMRYVEAIYA